MREIGNIIKKKFEVNELPTGKEICEQRLIKVIDDIEKVKGKWGGIGLSFQGIIVNWDWLSKEDLIKRICFFGV